MSTSVRGAVPEKKISSCVRPGVCEVRASALRLVRALTRLDLPTLERPARAISTPSGGGSRSSVPAAAWKSQVEANSRRPASITASEAAALSPIASARPVRGLRLHAEHALDVVPQLHLHAVPAHDEALLKDRERVVPGPVDHQPGRERG